MNCKKYVQKDLGYPRTPTNRLVLLTFSNGEQWAIPAQLVCDDRDQYYTKERLVESDSAADCEDYDIIDWLSNNMNWSDVKEYAEKLREPLRIDYEEEFPNREKYFLNVTV